MAINYFSRTVVDGYNYSTGTWDAAIAQGDFLTFDRFITERSFGQKKRMFIVGERYLGTLDNYGTVRTPDGQIYLISAKNVDLDGYDGSTVYNNSFLLQRADFLCDVIRIDSALNAAGMPTGRTETVVGSYHCDMERFSNKSASEIDDIVYSQFSIWLPKEAEPDVTVDSEIRVDGTLYDVKEVDLMLGLVEIKAMKRG